ncbi:MAG: CsgG/HfaB family protein [Prevotellaceae bacterium]|jgi:hypothetical protein|nr:CsgG/HfaB family protein [Prevotellaceae bacterium]
MKKILILSACILWHSGIFAQDKKVAVFDPAGSVSASTKEIIREEISNVIVNTRGYSVLERQLINKVLEENKFQMGGLVDNSQIGEIGKKMGANAVFVTSVTPTGGNLYISFKMIDVQTARIEMQKTGKTTRGESDIDVVVQRVVGEMLGRVNTTSYKDVQPARTAPATSRNTSSGGLLANGMKVYYKGRLLNSNEVKSMMENTDALRIYENGLSRGLIGAIFVGAGIGFSVGALGLLAEEGDYSLISAGAILVGTGIVFRVLGKSSVRKAVNAYNGQLYSSTAAPELQFGLTRHGVGFVYRF